MDLVNLLRGRMLRRNTQTEISTTMAVLERLKENFQPQKTIYFDEIVGNVISVYKETVFDR